MNFPGLCDRGSSLEVILGAVALSSAFLILENITCTDFHLNLTQFFQYSKMLNNCLLFLNLLVAIDYFEEENLFDCNNAFPFRCVFVLKRLLPSMVSVSKRSYV